MNSDINTYKKEFYEQYFQWFFFKYGKIYSLVRQMLVVLCAFVLLTYLIFATARIASVVTQYPFPVYYNSDGNSFLRIKNLPDSGNYINKVYAEYFFKQYLDAYMSFDSESIQENVLENKLNFIYNTSSMMVFQKYLDSLNISKNSKSPLLIYRFNNSRKVEITNISFENEDVVLPTHAIVGYKVTDIVNNVKTVVNKAARVIFYMSMINEEIINGDKKYSFIITDIK